MQEGDIKRRKSNLKMRSKVLRLWLHHFKTEVNYIYKVYRISKK